MKNSMMIIKGSFQNLETFEMIPSDKNCPYVKVTFEPYNKVLILMGVIKSQQAVVIDKLDEAGYPKVIKKGAHAGKNEAQRVFVDTHQEYYIRDIQEIKDFVSHFGPTKQSANTEKLLKEMFANTVKEDNEKKMEEQLAKQEESSKKELHPSLTKVD